MLRILGCHRDHIADFWPFKSMDSTGLAVDNDTYTYITLCSNFKQLKAKEPAPAADEEIQSATRIILDLDNWDGKLDFFFSLSETSVSKILREDQYSPRKALAFFHAFRSFLEECRYSETQKLLFSSPHHIGKHPDIAKLFGSVKGESDKVESDKLRRRPDIGLEHRFFKNK